MLRVDGDLLVRALSSRDKKRIELVTLDEAGKPAATQKLVLARHEVRIEGVIVAQFMGVDISDLYFLGDLEDARSEERRRAAFEGRYDR